jgi:GT2 family glycosyltransferase/glycosyltransferase involved in cell wall biosynthesis
MTTSASRPRLLVLSQVYRPEPNFITADVAESLSRHFDVTVVAAHPNYPHSHFYPGHRWWWPQRTTENGVVVWRLPMYPYHGRSHTLRALSYLSFAALAAVFAPFAAPRPHIVWAYHGPFTVGLAALWFRFVVGARVIFTCADLWPESFVAAGVARPGLKVRLLFAYRRALNRAADVLICATRGTQERYMEDGVAAEALPLVPVWVDGAGQSTSDEPDPPGPKRLVYAGNLGPAQSLETVIRAAAIAERDGLPIVFDLYGSGNAEAALRQAAERLAVTSVNFRGQVSPQTAFEVSSRAFAQIVSLQPSPLFAMTVPSKVAFCCSAGAPILYGLQGEAAGIVAEAGGGVAFDPADPHTLVTAIKDLLARSDEDRKAMRGALRAYYERHLAKPKLLARYEEIFLDLMSPAPAGAEWVAADRAGRADQAAIPVWDAAMAAPLVTISVVSHRQNRLVNQLLRDIDRHCPANVGVIATENVPDSEPLVTAGWRYPIEVVRNTERKGFGANHNAAFSLCRSPFFCVANPDIRLHADPFPGLIRALASADAGVAGPLVRSPTGVIEDSARRFPTAARLLRKALWGSSGPDYPVNQGVQEVDCVAGMFMLLPSRVFERLSGFDPAYFLYYEDIDLCGRLNGVGKRRMYVPTVEVCHDARRDSHRRLAYASHHLRSALRWLLSDVVSSRSGRPRRRPTGAAARSAAGNGSSLRLLGETRDHGKKPASGV